MQCAWFLTSPSPCPSDPAWERLSAKGKGVGGACQVSTLASLCYRQSIISLVLVTRCRLRQRWTAALWMLCFLPFVDLFCSPMSQHCAGQGHRMHGGLYILVHSNLFIFNNSNRLLRSVFKSISVEGSVFGVSDPPFVSLQMEATSCKGGETHGRGGNNWHVSSLCTSAWDALRSVTTETSFFPNLYHLWSLLLNPGTCCSWLVTPYKSTMTTPMSPTVATQLKRKTKSPFLHCFLFYTSPLSVFSPLLRQDLILQPRLASNSWFSCSSFLSDRITSMHHT